MAAYVIMGCAIVLTATLLFRELRTVAPPAQSGLPEAVEDLPHWEQVAEEGHRIGPEEATLRIVVFSDFECPACRSFALETVSELRRQYPGEVALFYRHFPLQQHRFSYYAAQASECAATQDAFVAYHDVLFANQDSLGLKSLTDLAVEAEIRDVVEFDRCLWSGSKADVVDRDVEVARSLDARGTPTIIINGTLLRRVAPQLVDSVVRAKVDR